MLTPVQQQTEPADADQWTGTWVGIIPGRRPYLTPDEAGENLPL